MSIFFIQIVNQYSISRIIRILHTLKRTAFKLTRLVRFDDPTCISQVICTHALVVYKVCCGPLRYSDLLPRTVEIAFFWRGGGEGVIFFLK